MKVEILCTVPKQTSFEEIEPNRFFFMLAGGRIYVAVRASGNHIKTITNEGYLSVVTNWVASDRFLGYVNKATFSQ